MDDKTSRLALARWLTLCLAALLSTCGPAAGADGLSRLRFEPNPGHLEAYLYVPKRPQDPAPLVVALHGCGQRAADSDDETGWATLAEEAGFLLLLPEQTAYNNPARCFDWFNPPDLVRDHGEPGSIRRMVEAVEASHPVDPRRVFVSGLSAGAGMASILLATYPDLFAAGAMVGGVPYGCAGNSLVALLCMRFGNRLVSGPLAWAERVFAAAPKGTARWPRVSIWHDPADNLVAFYNAQTSVDQWTAVQGIDQVPDRHVAVGPHEHIVYANGQGRPLVELWIIRGAGHAMPIDERSGCGRDDPNRTSDFVRNAGICAAREIARFWGLIGR